MELRKSFAYLSKITFHASFLVYARALTAIIACRYTLRFFIGIIILGSINTSKEATPFFINLACYHGRAVASRSFIASLHTHAEFLEYISRPPCQSTKAKNLSYSEMFLIQKIGALEAHSIP